LRIVKVAGGEDDETFFVFYLSISLYNLLTLDSRSSPFTITAFGHGPGPARLFLGRAGFRRKPGQAQARASLNITGVGIPVQRVLASCTALDQRAYKVTILSSCHLPSLSLFTFIFSASLLPIVKVKYGSQGVSFRWGFAPYVHLIYCVASSRLRVASSLSIPCVQISFAISGY
jgi:hypothetical protein